MYSDQEEFFNSIMIEDNGYTESEQEYEKSPKKTKKMTRKTTRKNSQRMSKAQIEKITSFMRCHEDFTRHKVNEDQLLAWKSLTNELNEMGPAVHNDSKWRLVWSSYKQSRKQQEKRANKDETKKLKDASVHLMYNLETNDSQAGSPILAAQHTYNQSAQDKDGNSNGQNTNEIILHSLEAEEGHSVGSHIQTAPHTVTTGTQPAQVTLKEKAEDHNTHLLYETIKRLDTLVELQKKQLHV